MNEPSRRCKDPTIGSEGIKFEFHNLGFEVETKENDHFR
jgi:hypothetical protein